MNNNSAMTATDFNTGNSMIPIDSLSRMIYTIRGQQVMLDSDLAVIYGIEVKRLSEQVKRNSARFPDSFRFQLNNDEYQNLKSQFATSSEHGGRRHLPYVFTEQGVSMLSAVLHSETAIQVSIRIINAFVEMRRFISSNASLFSRLESIEKRQHSFEIDTNHNFEKVFQALDSAEPPKQGIFFNGQVFDAYTFVADLIRSAKKSIVLIDNYIDDSVLTLFSKRQAGVSVGLYTKTVSKQLKNDVDKFNQQYPSIQIHSFDQSHDRFMIIDGNELYHIGASLKDLGKKWFAFSRFERGVLEVLDKLGGLK